MVSFYKIVLVSILFLVSVSGVCAADPDNNNDSLTTVEDNNLQLNNYTVLSASVDVGLNNNTKVVKNCNKSMLLNLTNNTVTNDSSDSVGLSTVPCAVSSYISVMESYNKTVDVETGIKETHTVNNITSVEGLVNALTNQGLKCNVIKTKSIDDLKPLYNDTNVNVILHMFIKPNYHYALIKEVKTDGILFNDNLFIPFNFLKVYYTNIFIIVTNKTSLNLSCFGENVNKSEWANITGKLTQKALFNHNYGLINKSITLNREYNTLKDNIKNESNKKGIESTEFILFGDTLKPKMVNLLKIQKQLKPIYNNPNSSNKLLSDLNNILVPMQPNLNDTITGLETLITMIKKHCINNDNLKSSNVVVSPPPKQFIDVPKLLGDCGSMFVDGFKKSVNNLNPLNAHPELREELDQKYGLEHHKFGFIDYYTLKKDKKGE